MNHVNDFYYDPESLSKSEVKLIDEKIQKIITLLPQRGRLKDDNLMFFDDWCHDNKVSNKDADIILNELKDSEESILYYEYDELVNSIILSYYGDVVVVVKLDGLNTFVITL